MKDGLFWGVLGFVLGAFAGGYVVGTQCAKKHKKVVEELQDEIDNLIDESEKTAQKGLYGAHRGIVEAQSNIRSDEDDDETDIFDEDYDFDDPFEDDRESKNSFEETLWNSLRNDPLHKKNKHSYPDAQGMPVIIKDQKTGEEFRFSSLSNLLDTLDWEHACETSELMSKAISGDTNAYRKLAERYSSENLARKVGDRDHPHDSGEDDYDPDDIYLIDAQTFKKEMIYRDDETVTYYQQDGVLINSADQLIDNQERCIGREALDIIGSTDQDYLYVDNQVENKVYEICIDHLYSYYKDVASSGGGA